MEMIPTSPTASYMPLAMRAQALNRAYVRAVAAKAGAVVLGPEDDFGTDLAFAKVTRRKSGRLTVAKSIIVPFQLKASKKWEFRGDTVIYDLEAKNYNDMVDESSMEVLILMCLPSTFDEWLYQDEECLRLHRCCYYWQPTNHVEKPNKDTVRIVIPRSQIFTPDVLILLLDQAQARVIL
jgi:hypothetical protein